MMMQHNTRLAFTAVMLGAVAASTALGVPIFSQTPDIHILTSTQSDSHAGPQVADDLTLAAPDTARSVTWRGYLFPLDTLKTPISFDLIFYGSSTSNSSIPDDNLVLSTTTVTFHTLDEFTDTGLDVGGSTLYEFQANLTPTALPDTKVWFSVWANTTNDTDDRFYWASGYDSTPVDNNAYRISSHVAYSADTGGPMYFILDNQQIPEPTTLGLAILAALTAASRRARIEPSFHQSIRP